MDIVHHSLIGGVGFSAAMTQDAPLVGAAFVAGSVLPDLDVIFMAFGKRFYLRNHQGVSHAIPLFPFYALLIAWGLSLLPQAQLGWPVFLAALAGLLLHSLLDWLNTFRIALFYPFTRRRFSFDVLFFIDAVALALTSGFYLAYYVMDLRQALLLYPLLFSAYLVFRILLRVSIQRQLKADFIIPSSLNPFSFYILESHGSEANAYLYNALSGRKDRHSHYPAVADEDLALMEKSSLFQDMRYITRAYRIVKVEQKGDVRIIHAADIAVRNFGGRFARMQVHFNPQGEIIHEVADI